MAKSTRAPRHTSTTPVPVEQVAQSILLLRGKRVILDRELAAIYGVPTGRLNEAVKRNVERFPEDFMFQLTGEEAELSRSQSVILNPGRGRLIRTPRIENRDDAFLSQVHILPAIKCNQSIVHLSGLGRGEECSHNFLERCLV